MMVLFSTFLLPHLFAPSKVNILAIINIISQQIPSKCMCVIKHFD